MSIPKILDLYTYIWMREIYSYQRFYELQNLHIHKSEPQLKIAFLADLLDYSEYTLTLKSRKNHENSFFCEKGKKTVLRIFFSFSRRTVTLFKDIFFS